MRRFAFAGCIAAFLMKADATLAAVQVPIDTINGVPTYIGSCWKSPPLAVGKSGAKITVLMSFKRSGELLGKPRVTFQSAGPVEDEVVVREAAALAIMRCTPLPLTDALGGAIAGRLFRITFDLKTGQPI